MKAKLNAACILLTMAIVCVVPAHAQLSSYLDDQGRLVYTNSEIRTKPAVAAKPLASAQGGQLKNASLQSAVATSGPSGSDPAASPLESAAPKAPAPPQPLITAPAALDNLVQKTAERHNVDPELVRAVISTESNWNASAVSRRGAQGLMQLVPQTAHSLGVGNAFDPAQNVDAGVRYLGMMLQRYNGDLKLALAAYNAGPSAVDRFRGVPSYRETRNYVDKVTSTYFRPGSERRPFGLLASSRPIYRTTDSDGRVVFTNE